MDELICEFKAVLYWIENFLLKNQLDEIDIYEHENILHYYKSFIKDFEKRRTIITLNSYFKNLKIT